MRQLTIIIIVAVVVFSLLAAYRRWWAPAGSSAVPGATRQETDHPTDRYTLDRQRMVDTQIRARGVRDERVLEVMSHVPRHLFVPAGSRSLAYEDTPLLIGQGQTISQPYIVALMTAEIHPRPEMRVLEIGTGSGYQAAVLSRLVKEVYSIEIVPELAAEATTRLKDLGYDNVRVLRGNGYLGWPNQAPFDAILVTAAPEDIPPALVEQLAPGGRMVIPVGPVGAIQSLLLIEKDESGRVHQSSLIPVRFVPMVRNGN